MPTPEAPKVDGKDFLEHLRTVHFSLLAVCVALVVVVTSPSRSSLDDA